MTRKELQSIVSNKIVILDGATGTELAKHGMPAGACPEQWVLENPSAITAVQRAYVEAGSDAVYTPTFGGNRFKLDEFGLGGRVGEINRSLAALSRRAAGDSALVIGDVAPTGRFVEPFGDLGFEDAVAAFSEQIDALARGGVDAIVIETMIDLQETRAAVIAAKETCDLPLMVSMTFGTEGRTLNGTDPLSALITLQSLGADIVGCNCSTGPETMAQVIGQLKPHATVPLLAKPNAGMPVLRDGVTVFDMSADDFCAYARLLLEAGVNVLGGCCGTSPVYIAGLKRAASQFTPVMPPAHAGAAVCSYQKSVHIGRDRPLAVIGAEINPSGKPALKKELLNGSFSLLRDAAREQERLGADIIDINVHVPGGDETGSMRNAVMVAAKSAALPVAIDTMDPAVAEQALRVYPGRALLTSVPAKVAVLEPMLRTAARYGAMIVCTPVTGLGVPVSVQETESTAEKVLARAAGFGIAEHHCLVDCLVAPAAEGADRGRMSLDLVEWCSRTRGVHSIFGVSNCTYGPDERRWPDSTFLSMAAGKGLNAALLDSISEQTVNIAYACNALLGRDRKFSRYLKRFVHADSNGEKQPPGAGRTPAQAVFDAVVNGDEERISRLIDRALKNGEQARDLVDNQLIPAITLVGDKFDKKEYFLPQLITCADTMRAGFDVLQPILDESEKLSDTPKGPRVLLATVQGDIHDIGKNIVALMLKNYSFDVVDLGKDVSAEDIIRAARRHNAAIIGLSALMTTTMVEMKRIIELARARGLADVKFMIGGAVVDQHYADEIGAHGYAGDAMEAVRLAGRLSGKKS
ncbi:MAG: 5-methyltetrahydrofolate--homocysteine methyltransferase [Chitinivibrionales bacterium]|nr:5-methyltetrahydrofolate--homocysteine methyltransferase [Chitinivibrionales bacterium]